MAVAGKFNIQVSSLKRSQLDGRGQGDARARLSADEAARLTELFAGLRCTVAEQVPEPLRGDALARADQLEQAVVRERPDPRAIRRELHWFRSHAPHVLRPVMDVLVHPLVGALVERAGAPVADRFRASLEAAH
jgi:hypothetical protein